MSQQPTLKSQTRKMVFDVFNYFLQENNVTYSLNKTAEATQKSLSTVKRIVKESKSSGPESVAFRTPGKKRQKIKPVTGIDELHKGIIRRCIHYFHLTENELPTNRKLLNKLRTDINFQGSEKSLRSIMKGLGFKWKATEDKRRVLLEKSTIRLSRINYIRKLNHYRQENRAIIYADVLYVHATQTIPKVGADSSTSTSDQNESSTKGLKKTRLKGDRYVIVHAGSESGFVPNALVTFKSGMTSGDYQGDMSFENYEKWIRTQLIPNLPPNSVIVADNTSYLNRENDMAPNAESRKDDMQAWLLEKGITFTYDMMKPQLYELIKNNKDRYKIFTIDKVLKEHGHDLLRLPPHHPDLSPIKMAWAAIKSYVSSKNVPWNGARVIDLVKEKVNAMGPCDWKELCDKVRAIEEAYVTSDHIVDELTDELIFVHGGDSDGSDSELDYSSDESGTAGTSSGLPFESYLEVVMCDSD